MEQIPSKEYYEERIKSLINLPTLPIIATQIIRISREDRLSVNQMLPIIEKDPPLAMRVLKIANSPFYGLTEKVQSLRHAIVVIGLNQLAELATAFSIIRAFDEKGDELLPWRLFWEHSSATGFMAQMIAEELGLSTGENLYSVGLLHDIGKLVLHRVDPRRYKQAYRLIMQKRVTSSEAEEEVFGFSHTEAGFWIGERWELPQSIRLGIAHHHKLEQVNDERIGDLVAIINLADAMVNFWIARFGTKAIPPKPESLTGWQYLLDRHVNNTWPNLETLMERFKEQSPVITEMVRLIQH